MWYHCFYWWAVRHYYYTFMHARNTIMMLENHWADFKRIMIFNFLIFTRVSSNTIAYCILITSNIFSHILISDFQLIGVIFLTNQKLYFLINDIISKTTFLIVWPRRRHCVSRDLGCFLRYPIDRSEIIQNWKSCVNW